MRISSVLIRASRTWEDRRRRSRTATNLARPHRSTSKSSWSCRWLTTWIRISCSITLSRRSVRRRGSDRWAGAATRWRHRISSRTWATVTIAGRSSGLRGAVSRILLGVCPTARSMWWTPLIGASWNRIGQLEGMSRWPHRASRSFEMRRMLGPPATRGAGPRSWIGLMAVPSHPQRITEKLTCSSINRFRWTQKPTQSTTVVCRRSQTRPAGVAPWLPMATSYVFCRTVQTRWTRRRPWEASTMSGATR